MIKLGNILKEIKVLKPNSFKYKTAEWWLYQLPEPYRTQALTNFKNNPIKETGPIYNSLHAAIDGFAWAATPEGGDYWSEIWYKLVKNKPLTEIKVLKPNPFEPNTPEWWFYKLPEPYRKQALTNFRNDPDYEQDKNLIYSNLHMALNNAFRFDNVPEGWRYWDNIYFKLLKKEPITEIKVVKPDIPKKGTMLWWFYQLPEPYRTQAINNFKKTYNWQKRTDIKNSLEKAINQGFIWIDTPEGDDYWREITFKLKNNEPLTEIKVVKPNPFKPNTCLWWLYKLPEPYRTQALNNYKNDRSDYSMYRENREFDSIGDALHWAFAWEHTPEGGAYWYDVYDEFII